MKNLSILHKLRFYVSIVIVSLLFLSPILINYDKILSSADITMVYSPYKLFFANSLKTYLELPLWNPYMFSGSPFLANPTSGMLNPLNYLFLVFNPDFVFGYLFIIDTTLIGIFTYAYCRTIKISEHGSLLAAFSFAFCGTIGTRIYPGHLFIVDAFVWFPLILLFFEKIISTKKIVYIIPTAITFSLLIFSGHTQITFYSIFISFFYLIIRGLYEYRKKLSELIIIYSFAFFSLVCGLGLSAIQLIPTLEFSNLSVRSLGISYEFASNFSTHPYQLLSFILPNFYGSNVNNTFWGQGNEWESIAYLGMFPIILGAVSILSKKNKYIFIFVLLAIFSVFFALGNHFYLFPIFFKHIPFFDNFRAPGRMLFIYSFSVSILAGYGFDAVCEINLRKIKNKLLNWFNKILLSIAFLIQLLLVYLYFNTGFNLYEKYILKNSYAVGINHIQLYNQLTADLLFLSLLLDAYLLLLYLFEKKIINILLFKYLVIAVVILNSFYYVNKYIIMDFPRNIYKTTPIIDRIKKDKSLFRIFDFSRENYAILNRNNLQSITGVDAIYLKNLQKYILSIGKYKYLPYDSYIDLTSIDNQNLLNLLNVKYLISNKKLNLKNYSYVASAKIEIAKNITDLNLLYVNNKLLPRAYIVQNSIVINNENKIIDLIKKGIDFEKFVILKKGPIVSNKLSTKSKVNIQFYSPNKIIVRVDTDQPGFLVLSEVWYPGWKAYINGKETEIFTADYILRAINITRGKSYIVFSYQPNSVKIGVIISLISIAILFVITGWYYKTKIKNFYLRR